MKAKFKTIDLELDEKTKQLLDLRKKYLDDYENVIFKSLGVPPSLFGEQESITKNNKMR